MCVNACMNAQSCLTLSNPMDCSPPGFSAHETPQAGILEWVAISFSSGSSRPRDQTHDSWVSCMARWILYHCTTREDVYSSMGKRKSKQREQVDLPCSAVPKEANLVMPGSDLVIGWPGKSSLWR